MADDKDKPNPPSGGITMADIRRMVTETVGEVMKGVTGKPDDKPADKPGETGTKENTPGDMASIVRNEIKRIKDHEKATERDATIDTKLAELSAAVVEKPPVERRRVHKFMGWGE